jgi:hypothetical protein
MARRANVTMSRVTLIATPGPIKKDFHLWFLTVQLDRVTHPPGTSHTSTEREKVKSPPSVRNMPLDANLLALAGTVGS